MNDAAHLERRFDAAMLDVSHGAARLGYRPTRFLEMVQMYGGVETAHRLLAADKIQDGLGELFLLGRLDLTVEAHVLLPEFAPLFSNDERRTARLRLGIPEPAVRDMTDQPAHAEGIGNQGRADLPESVSNLALRHTLSAESAPALLAL